MAFVSLASLWLPIVLSAVFVFIASSIFHMVLPFHRSDYKKLPDEDKLLDAIRAANPAPGLYHFPHCTHKDMGSAETMEKYKRGPVGHMTVIPAGPIFMPKYLGLWFVHCLVIGFFVAYLASRTLAPGTHYLQVFRVVGTASFIGYGLALFSDFVWKNEPGSNTVKGMIDGLIYALLTAGTFGWLWPR